MSEETERYSWTTTGMKHDPDGKWVLQSDCQQSAGVPEGWKLVPIDPDLQMVIAGENYIGQHAWKEMINASPEPPKTGNDDKENAR